MGEDKNLRIAAASSRRVSSDGGKNSASGRDQASRNEVEVVERSNVEAIGGYEEEPKESRENRRASWCEDPLPKERVPRRA